MWIQHIAETKEERGEGNSWKDGEGLSQDGSCVHTWQATHQIWAETDPQSAVNTKSPANSRTEHPGGRGLGSGLDLAWPYAQWLLALCPMPGCLHKLRTLSSPTAMSCFNLIFWAGWGPCHSEQPTLSDYTPSAYLVLVPHLSCQISCHVLSELYVLRTHVWPCLAASPAGALVQPQGGWARLCPRDSVQPVSSCGSLFRGDTCRFVLLPIFQS